MSFFVSLQNFPECFLGETSKLFLVRGDSVHTCCSFLFCSLSFSFEVMQEAVWPFLMPPCRDSTLVLY